MLQRYSKEEDLKDFSSFDFLVTERPFVEGFQVDEAIQGFDGINKTIPPSVRFAEKIFIHRRDL